MTETREHFRLRSYQRAPLLAKQAGCKRFVSVWHRRAGKDRTWLAITLLAAMERVGVYFHIFPSLNQGRRDLWDNVVHETVDGVERPLKILDMFPPELIASVNQTEMQIRFTNGSIWQIMGADSTEAVERLRGPNPVGLVFSEYAFMQEAAWTTLAPVLAQNHGWAAFAYTPKDEGHGKTLYDYAKDAPDWFCQLLTVDDTRQDAQGESGAPVIETAEIEAYRRQGQREEDLQREYYCAFTGYLHGTIYGDLMTAARTDGRVTRVPYTVNLPVGTCWDIGTSDATAIWFYQRMGQQILFMDYHEDTLKGAQDYARVLREQKPYQYARMILPHDAKWSAEDYFSSVGFRGIEIARKLPVQSGIDQVRQTFSRFVFDEQKCARGLQCLDRYAREWDDTARAFRQSPRHDEYSHGADALRYGTVAGFDPLEFYANQGKPVTVETAFDPRIVGATPSPLFPGV